MTWELLFQLFFILLVIVPTGVLSAVVVTYLCTDAVPDFRRWQDARHQPRPTRHAAPEWTWTDVPTEHT